VLRLHPLCATTLLRLGDAPLEEVEFLKNGAGGSPLIKLVSERMRRSDFTPNFLLRLMTKDLGYAVDDARRRSLDLVIGSAAHSVFKQAIAVGYGDKDMSAVVQQFRNT